jgi:hypothetical protein
MHAGAHMHPCPTRARTRRTRARTLPSAGLRRRSALRRRGQQPGVRSLQQRRRGAAGCSPVRGRHRPRRGCGGEAQHDAAAAIPALKPLTPRAPSTGSLSTPARAAAGGVWRRVPLASLLRNLQGACWLGGRRRGRRRWRDCMLTWHDVNCEVVLRLFDRLGRPARVN